MLQKLTQHWATGFMTTQVRPDPARLVKQATWMEGRIERGRDAEMMEDKKILKRAASDDRLKEILQEIKTSKTPAVINYGASWCRVCSQILPAFCELSNEFKKLSFVYADIDECPEATESIRYTPTFHFYRDGDRVDEMLGAGKERLHDRLWLHS